VKVIDDFVASLEQSDAARLATLLRYMSAYCTAAPDDIFPPCPAGAPEKSPVDAVFMGRCEAGWVPRDVDLSSDLARFVKGGQRLYAAISLPTPGSWITDYHWPTGNYFVVMDVPGGPSGEPRGAILDESGVVALLTGCYFQSPEGFLMSHLQAYAGQSAVPTFIVSPPD
jgi:hypothetical protein